MKKTKKILAVLSIITILIVLTGCDMLGFNKNKAIKVSNLYTGTKGLSMEFIKNAPPSEIYENSPFNAIIKIKNNGAYQIGYDVDEEGILEQNGEIKGIIVLSEENGYYSVNYDSITTENSNIEVEDTDKQIKFSLRGRTLTDNRGEEDIIYIGLDSKSLGSLSQKHPSVLYATACYPYQTKLSTTVCLDTDTYNIQQAEKACQLKDIIISNGQGGPVSINKIEMRMTPIDSDDKKIFKPELILYIENKGKGEIVKDFKQACSKKIRNSDEPSNNFDLKNYFNMIKINPTISKGDKQIVFTCTKNDKGIALGEEDYVRLSGKISTVRCIVDMKEGKTKENALPTQSTPAYTAPLDIEIDYGYMSTVSKSFSIKK